MSNKVFFSYRYLEARNYIMELEKIFSKNNSVFRIEKNDEDLGSCSDELVKEKIKDKLFDTIVTVVFVSKTSKNSKWMPWEILYSLQSVNRINNDVRANGVVCVVIPNPSREFKNDNYAWAKSSNFWNPSAEWNPELFPPFIFKNRDNLKPEYVSNGDDPNYISIYTWEQFKSNYDEIIKEAKNKNQEFYKLTKLTN